MISWICRWFGCFLINTSKSVTNKLGFRSTLRFQITQGIRDALLMENITKFLLCGNCFNSKKESGIIVNFVL